MDATFSSRLLKFKTKCTEGYDRVEIRTKSNEAIDYYGKDLKAVHELLKEEALKWNIKPPFTAWVGYEKSAQEIEVLG